MRSVVLVLLAACGSDPQPAPASITRIELGTGVDAFAPLAPTGAQLELQHGPQGGWHVWVAARIWSDEPAGPDGIVLVYDASSPTKPMGKTSLALTNARLLREDDHWLRLGDLVILDVTGPADVVGMTLELTATVDTVSDGRSAMVIDAIP
ncbi:MAG: hypothetical protein NT062_35395 [Proteobacteria bacterium]|nr:hypothetical protein [Pseudomonadota bacterium]